MSTWSTPDARTILPVTATREEWLTARQPGIGGTDVAALVGVRDYPDQTPWHVWAKKTGVYQTPDKLIFRRGHDLEPLIAARFTEEHPDHPATRRVGTLQSKRWPHLIASPDRLTDDGGGLDMKSTTSRATARWGDSPPESYIWQAHHYLAVTGRTHWFIGALEADTWEFHWWRIDRDPDVIEWMAETTGTWWRNHLADGGTEPDFDGGEDEAKARWPIVTDTALRVPEDHPAVDLVDEYRRLKRDEKATAAALSTIKGDLRGIAQGYEAVETSTGRKLFTLKESTARRLDATKLRESEPEIAESFTRETITRTLRVV